MGKNFFANYNCTILDVAKVKIGDNCQMAPNAAIYTAGHPIHPDTRNTLYEYGREVTIGDNVWIGGNSVICPGVHVGSNVVIGAGSVVTKDIPDWSVAAGNPCRVIRRITEADRRRLFRDEEIDDEAWEDIKNRERRSNYALKLEQKPRRLPFPDQNGTVHTLEEYRGKKVILIFIRKDNTSGCTKQACGFRDLYPQFMEKGAAECWRQQGQCGASP